MNNTRRIQTFIGAMILAAVSCAGYAGYASHTWHGFFAMAVLAISRSHLADESKATRHQRQHVDEPAVPAYGRNQPECSGSSCDRLHFNRGAMLATERREIQSAADGVQPQHDDLCRLAGKPHAPRVVAARHDEDVGISHGDGHPVPGTDWPGSRNRRGERREISRRGLVGPGAPFVSHTTW